ncbi:MAG: sensor histidine kinase [Nitrosopumilaceae archaeon]
MLENTKTSFKIGGSVGIIILLLGITIIFGMYQMSKVSNEIIEISEEYTPLYEIISEVKFQKLNQASSFEKILRFSNSNNILEFEKAKEEFWISGANIDSGINRGKNILNVGKDIATSEKSNVEFNILLQQLSNIEIIHDKYQNLAADLFLKLNELESNNLSLKQFTEIENELDNELNSILSGLSTLIDESSNQIEINERDSLIGQIIIMSIVGILAATLGFFISQINNDLKKEIELKTSELMNANEKLKELDKMKDEFIGIASHELKSPLQPILGFAELAKSGDIDQKEAWEGVFQLTSKLQDLANAVLDVSKIERNKLELQLEKIKINDLITDITKSEKINLKKPIIIRENFDENIIVEADKMRLGQVLRNLLNNAIKFTPNGTISIETHVYHEKNEIQIKITDTGVGIPEEVLPNIFGKFVTKGIKNEKSGTGLGLFLCKGIVEAHNGRILAKNNFDEGASFEFTIPISQKNIVSNSSEIAISTRK